MDYFPGANHSVSIIHSYILWWTTQRGFNSAYLLIVCSGDIEVNLGPEIKSQVLFCHWNLNGLAAHNLIKLSLLQALPVTHGYDIICLSKTFLASSIYNEDLKISIEGYNLLRANDPINKNRGGVCMFHKGHLPIIKRDDLCTLKE